MPYGIPNETPTQTAKMERCVKKVMADQPNLSESSAIAICKTSLGYTKKNELRTVRVRRSGCPC